MKDINKILAKFLSDMREIESEYTWNFEAVSKCDKATQDILHELEFGDYEIARKNGPKVAKIRKARRICKDAVDIAEPLYSWLISQEGMLIRRKLEKILGQVRKEQGAKCNRKYYPRVIKDLTFLNSDNNCNNSAK